jgi:hypothetical protein
MKEWGMLWKQQIQARTSSVKLKWPVTKRKDGQMDYMKLKSFYTTK